MVQSIFEFVNEQETAFRIDKREDNAKEPVQSITVRTQRNRLREGRGTNNRTARQSWSITPTNHRDGRDVRVNDLKRLHNVFFLVGKRYLVPHRPKVGCALASVRTNENTWRSWLFFRVATKEKAASQITLQMFQG